MLWHSGRTPGIAAQDPHLNTCGRACGRCAELFGEDGGDASSHSDLGWRCLSLARSTCSYADFFVYGPLATSLALPSALVRRSLTLQSVCRRLDGAGRRRSMACALRQLRQTLARVRISAIALVMAAVLCVLVAPALGRSKPRSSLGRLMLRSSSCVLVHELCGRAAFIAAAALHDERAPLRIQLRSSAEHASEAGAVDRAAIAVQAAALACCLRTTVIASTIPHGARLRPLPIAIWRTRASTLSRIDPAAQPLDHAHWKL